MDPPGLKHPSDTATLPNSKKRSNDSVDPPSSTHQSSLLSFFRSNKNQPRKKIKTTITTKKEEELYESGRKEEKENRDDQSTVPNKPSELGGTKTFKNDDKSEEDDDNDDKSLNPIIPTTVPTPRNAVWSVQHGCVLVRTVRNEQPRTKVAAFDMDGTLLVWRCSGWPSSLDHYELWTRAIPQKLRQLYDDGGYKLVIISNQGGIRKALNGKNATRARALIDWLATKVDRPLYAIMSADKKSGYHKPSPKLWDILEQRCNKGVAANIQESFYVGDSTADNDDDPQGGVDSKFAENVSRVKGLTLRFQHPEQYFGPSDSHKRKRQGEMAAYERMPPEAQKLLPSLTGGYFSDNDGTTTTPILLMLCGAQGSGKSTFCEKLLQDGGDNHWVHLSQDTINNGKPGKREKVEAAAIEVLKNKEKTKSVVVDRMHLDEQQRMHFVNVAKSVSVVVHAVLLHPPKDLVTKRVRERTNHPGGVQGDSGVRIAVASLSRVKPPKYEEGFQLIWTCPSQESANQVCDLYRSAMAMTKGKQQQETQVPLKSTTTMIAPGIHMPTLVLGTMSVGKRIASKVIADACRTGWKGVDTAPTYKNESEVGSSLFESDDVFVIVKVPKRATSPRQVRQELEESLGKLNRSKVDLLLLHWPSDVMEAGSLESVWKEMEGLVQEGTVHSIGVCNFGIDALRQLLPICTIPPAVNQVERHPLLPQWELVQFCWNNGITMQAHTPLGQGRLLDNPVLRQIGEEADMSVAQVTLRWNLQHGISVVTKASTEKHLQEGIDTTKRKSLTPQQMKVIDSIDTTVRFVAPPFMYGPGLVYGWGDRIPKKK